MPTEPDPRPVPNPSDPTETLAPKVSVPELVVAFCVSQMQ